jgi:hypothetical protein
LAGLIVRGGSVGFAVAYRFFAPHDDRKLPAQAD